VGSANRVKLSDKFIAQIAVDRPHRYWDTEMPNLVLVALPSGTTTFYVYYSLAGRKHWLKIDNAKSVRTETARLIALKTLADVRLNGKNPSAEVAAQRTAGTVSELITAFLRDRERRGNKSVDQTRRLLRNKIEPRLGKMLASSVTRGDIRKLAHSMDTTPIMANAVLNHCSAMFAFGMTQEEFRITANPCKGVTRNKTNDRKRIATAEEIRKIWTVMPAPCKLSMLTGLRPGNAMGIRSEMISDGFINFSADQMKAKEPFSIPLFAEIAPLVDAVKDRTWRKNTVGDLMRQACKAAGIPDLRPHDCRRTFRSFASAVGVPFDIAERMMAHKVGSAVSRVYDRYDHHIEMRAAWEKTAKRILEMAGGQTATVAIFDRHAVGRVQANG
jgi:integrase